MYTFEELFNAIPADQQLGKVSECPSLTKRAKSQPGYKFSAIEDDGGKVIFVAGNEGCIIFKENGNIEALGRALWNDRGFQKMMQRVLTGGYPLVGCAEVADLSVTNPGAATARWAELKAQFASTYPTIH